MRRTWRKSLPLAMLCRPEDRDRLAARLHRLRGSAAVLGARRVQRLAGEAESVLRARDSRPAQIQSAVAALAGASLRALDRDAHVWMAAQATMAEPAAGPTPAALPPDAAALRQLMRCCRTRTSRRAGTSTTWRLACMPAWARLGSRRCARPSKAWPTTRLVALLEPLLRQTGAGSAAS
jgi:hypothetical protein